MIDILSLKVLHDINYNMVEKNTLIDANEIILDNEDSILERVNKFIDEVKNPYIMKCGKTIVEVGFSENKKSIDSQIKKYLKSIKKDGYTC